MAYHVIMVISLSLVLYINKCDTGRTAMYLYKQKQKNGDLYLAIKEKYHVPGVGSREKTVEKIGYLSDLQKKYDDQ